jgi:hypothetical protein
MNEKYNMNCSLVVKDKTQIPGSSGTGTLAILKLNH